MSKTSRSVSPTPLLAEVVTPPPHNAIVRHADHTKDVDKENVWRATKQVSRCLSCNSLGGCACATAAALSPKTKKRRIEALMANTQFYQYKQDRATITLREQEVRARAALSDAWRRAWHLLAEQERCCVGEACERGMIARECAFAERRLASIADNLASAADRQEAERERLCAEAHQRLQQAFAEASAFVAGPIADLCTHERFAIVSRQRGLVEQLTTEVEAEAPRRCALATAESEARIGLAAMEACALRDMRVAAANRHAARERMVAEAVEGRALIADERSNDLYQLQSRYLKECRDLAVWVDSRRQIRQQHLGAATDDLHELFGAFVDGLSALHQQALDEHEGRLLWAQARADAREALAGDALGAMHSIVAAEADACLLLSQRFDEGAAAAIEAGHAKHTERVAVAEAFTASAEQFVHGPERAARSHLYDRMAEEATQRTAWIHERAAERAALEECERSDRLGLVRREAAHVTEFSAAIEEAFGAIQQRYAHLTATLHAVGLEEYAAREALESEHASKVAALCAALTMGAEEAQLQQHRREAQAVETCEADVRCSMIAVERSAALAIQSLMYEHAGTLARLRARTQEEERDWLQRSETAARNALEAEAHRTLHDIVDEHAELRALLARAVADARRRDEQFSLHVAIVQSYLAQTGCEDELDWALGLEPEEIRALSDLFMRESQTRSPSEHDLDAVFVTMTRAQKAVGTAEKALAHSTESYNHYRTLVPREEERLDRAWQTNHTALVKKEKELADRRKLADAAQKEAAAIAERIQDLQNSIRR